MEINLKYIKEILETCQYLAFYFLSSNLKNVLRQFLQ